MTQTAKYMQKAQVINRTIAEFRNDVKETILNYLFRNISFFTPLQKVRAVLPFEGRNIAGKTRIPYKVVHSVVSKFLIDLIYMRRFFKDNSVSYTPFNHLKKMNIYLHKFNRFAPVFDLERAQQNARILQTKLSQICFWPQFMTQVAIVIFVTDLNDPRSKKKITQTNLRALCDCSAYAFHRTRNKLGIVRI